MSVWGRKEGQLRERSRFHRRARQQEVNPFRFHLIIMEGRPGSPSHAVRTRRVLGAGPRCRTLNSHPGVPANGAAGLQEGGSKGQLCLPPSLQSLRAIALGRASGDAFLMPTLHVSKNDSGVSMPTQPHALPRNPSPGVRRSGYNCLISPRARSQSPFTDTATSHQ